jgi:two-component system, OmpR family, response regulator
MKLLLVEDDTKIADFIIKGLSLSGFEVEHASDGQSGCEKALSGNYDVAIVDIMLPQMDGLTLIQRLRESKVTTPVLILSARREVDDRVKGLGVGGDDYLTKPFAFSELLARVQALVRRAQGAAVPTVLAVADLTMNLLTREVKRGSEKIELQALEFNLLKYLMENAGQLVSKAMIIEHVWKYNFDPGSNLVEVRMFKLRDKIERQGAARLIHTVRGFGYVFKESAE